MLRHAAGYFLINQGHDVRVAQDFLGHKNIASIAHPHGAVAETPGGGAGPVAMAPRKPICAVTEQRCEHERYVRDRLCVEESNASERREAENLDLIGRSPERSTCRSQLCSGVERFTTCVSWTQGYSRLAGKADSPHLSRCETGSSGYSMRKEIFCICW
jgi:hypothetical protein